jgi:hypothetical protein
MPLLPPVIKAVLVSSFIFGVVIELGFALPISSYSKICETGVESGRFHAEGDQTYRFGAFGIFSQAMLQ